MLISAPGPKILHILNIDGVKKEKGRSPFLLLVYHAGKAVEVGLAFGFHDVEFGTHLAQENVLNLGRGEVLGQTALRFGENLLRGQSLQGVGQNLAQNRSDRLNQSGTSRRGRGLALLIRLRLGFGRSGVRLGKLVNHLLENCNGFLVGFGIARHVDGVDGVGESVLLGHSVLSHNESLSGL